MNRTGVMLKALRWIALFVIVGACVDPIKFETPPPAEIIILEGSITSDSGPYVVRILKALPLDSDSTVSAPVTGASIVLHSNYGETESFIETQPGEYSTGGAIQGRIGGVYYITLTLRDGATFESEPETILESGEVKEIRFQYEARTIQKPFGPVAADVLNIFIDATAMPSENKTSFVRWRFRGTYVIETNPELYWRLIPGTTSAYMDPWPCSGYEVEPALGGGKLTKKRECECCRCWVSQYESIPRLSDNDLVEGGEFRNLKIAEVPVTRATFYEKYRVTIDQMTLSKSAFDYFNIIRTQKEGVSNLFQPPPGKVVGNIKQVNADYQIVGLFWAASVHKKSLYITESDLPYKIPVDIIPYPCNSAYANSTTTKPADWDE